MIGTTITIITIAYFLNSCLKKNLRLASCRSSRDRV